MNKTDHQSILELVAEGLEIVAEGNTKAKARLNKWLEEKRKSAYSDGRQNSWTLERRAKHGEVMRSKNSVFVYSMEVFNDASYGGSLVAQLFFESLDDVAMLMGIRPNSLTVQFSTTQNDIRRKINHFDTVTRKVPRTDEIQFTKPNITKRESLAQLLGRLKLISKSVQDIAERGGRGTRPGRPSTKTEVGELPMPGGY